MMKKIPHCYYFESIKNTYHNPYKVIDTDKVISTRII